MTLLTSREHQQHSPPRDNVPDQGDQMSIGPTRMTEVDDLPRIYCLLIGWE